MSVRRRVAALHRGLVGSAEAPRASVTRMLLWRHPEFAKGLLVGAIAVAVVAPLGMWAFYSGSLLWPALAANFTASLLAFLVALAWDRREKQRERAEEEADHVKRIDEARSHERQGRQEEARRRFTLILDELKSNGRFLEGDAKPLLAGRVVLPQLSDGSWQASGPALAAIASDYELVAALSTFFGRVDELEWRLRHLLQMGERDDRRYIEAETERLIHELREELPGLIERVSTEAEKPSVIELPFIPSHTIVFGPIARVEAEASRRVVRGSGSRPVGPPYT